MPNRSLLQENWASPALEHLFADCGIAFIIVSADRKLVDVNDTFCQMTGYSRDELLAMTIDQLTWKDDLQLNETLFRSDAWQGNVVTTFEKRYITRSGAPLWCRGRSEPLSDGGNKSPYRLVMLENITVRKRNELFLEQMAAIVNGSSDAIFRSDTAGFIQFWSKGAERLYGYTASEAIGRNAGFIAAEPYSEEERLLFGKLFAGEVVRLASARSRTRDGRVLEVSIVIFPLKNREGTIVAYAAVHRDVGERRRLAEQLRLSQRMETAGLLAGAIAHDFNNILTVIKGSCDVLAGELSAPQLGRHVELIERSADKAASLTRQLLTFSRRQKVSPEVLDPAASIASLRPLMQRTLGEDITLATDLSSHWQIQEDPTQFEQMILNVSVNARQAMPKGGRLLIATCDLALTGEAPPVPEGWEAYVPGPLKRGDYVLVEISDTGNGMDREVLERIFEPFFTTKDKGRGTGLGLAVVYGMVMQAGGGLQVLSKKGEGTVFRILLPRVTVTAATGKTPAATVTPEGRRGRVLVVDDDGNVRGLIVRILEFAGYEVTQADSAEAVFANEALAAVDLIVSDVVMPGLSGPEFAQAWQVNHPAARFLFISGYVEDDSQTGLLMAGNFLAKPFKPAALLQKVEAMLHP